MVERHSLLTWKKEGWKKKASYGYQSTVEPSTVPSPPPPPPIRRCKRGLGIFRDQSYPIIDKEIVIRSLTAFARKIDLKISQKGALWSDSLPNSCRKINEVNAPCILKEIIKCFYLVPNHQVISVETLSYQLSWILFCNRYRFALYRAQRKSKHAFHFPLGSQLGIWEWKISRHLLILCYKSGEMLLRK